MKRVAQIQRATHTQKKKNTTTKHKKRIDRSPQRPQESKAADVDGLKATESSS